MIQFRQLDIPHHEYVFLYVDVFGVSLDRPGGRGQPWARGDQDDAVARDAFQVCFNTTPSGRPVDFVKLTASSYFVLRQSVKILTYREPHNHQYAQFVQQLKSDAYQMFNYTANYPLVSHMTWSHGCCHLAKHFSLQCCYFVC